MPCAWHSASHCEDCEMAACPVHLARRHRSALGVGPNLLRFRGIWFLGIFLGFFFFIVFIVHVDSLGKRMMLSQVAATTLCNLWAPWQEPHAKEWPGKSKIKLTKGCSSKKGANSGHSQRFWIQKHCCSPWLGLLVSRRVKRIQV